MNRIEIDFRGCGKLTLTRKAAETLKSYAPKGCPFSEYTLFDLLLDELEKYSWKFPCFSGTVPDFLALTKEFSAYSQAYADGIIACI